MWWWWFGWGLISQWVREYFAASIPVYTNKLNRPILIVSRWWSFPAPDHQQVKKQTGLCAGGQGCITRWQNVPIQIIPVQGEGGERMVAVYFPKQKVLYASDLVQQMRDKSFFIEYLSEVKAVVDRHKLDVETFLRCNNRPLHGKTSQPPLIKKQINNSLTIWNSEFFSCSCFVY